MSKSVGFVFGIAVGLGTMFVLGLLNSYSSNQEPASSTGVAVYLIFVVLCGLAGAYVFDSESK